MLLLRPMRLFLIAVLGLALALPAISIGSGTAGRLQVIAWANRATKTAVPPADAVKRGIYCKARPIVKLYAYVRFQGMKDKVASTATWYFNDKRVFVFPFRWEDGVAGRTAFELHRQKGALEKGRYAIEIRTGRRLVGKGAIALKFGAC